MALRRRYINLPHHSVFGERFPNSPPHGGSNRREGSFARFAGKCPHEPAIRLWSLPPPAYCKVSATEKD